MLKIDETTAAELKSEFKLTVKNVNRLEESDLNQEFFDKLFGEGVVTTEEEFRVKIREEVEGMMQQDAERKLQDDMYLYGLGKVNFDLPDEFLKRWLKATNEKLTAEELAGGYNDFAQNLKWTLIENKVMKAHDIQVSYDDILHVAKAKLNQQFQMYSPQPLADEEISKYAVQYLQNKENASKIFEEVKALKVFDYIRGAVTLEPKEVTNTAFKRVNRLKVRFINYKSGLKAAFFSLGRA